MKLGIVGLPNVGKSTLFNAITNAGAQSANYPFCTIEPNVGVVAVPDERIYKLSELYSSKKTVPAFVEFVDIAGLVKGASNGEGLGNKFLSHIRRVDAIVHVVRCFDDPNIVHVDGGIDPIRDIETINLELVLSDIELLGRAIDRTSKSLKSDKALSSKLDYLKSLKDHLQDGKTASSFASFDQYDEFCFDLDLITSKPVIYAANVDEAGFGPDENENMRINAIKQFADKDDAKVLKICAKLEEDICTLDREEKQLFLQELGLECSGLDRMIAVCYDLLGLMSYLTAGPDECRAWTIVKGTKAPAAAGKIHGDFERGFIRAEVVSYDDLMKCKSMATSRENGLVRSEGRDYVVKDGDVILFRFNV